MQWSPWQAHIWSWHGVQSSPWQDGGAQWSPSQVGGLTSAPPSQPELAKPATAPETPQTFTGALIGAVIVLPEPRPTLPMPVTLPLLPGAAPDTFVVAPPWQLEFEKPSSASEMLHRLIGALIGAVIVLPDTPETLPMPVTLPLPAVADRTAASRCCAPRLGNPSSRSRRPPRTRRRRSPAR